MVKDTLPWHEREDEDSEDSFTVSTDQPSGRFNADEIEFEPFMFDPGTGPLAAQSQPSVRVDAAPSVATMSSPLESQTVGTTSDAGFDSAQVPASLDAAPSGNGSGDSSPLEPWPATPNASVDFSPARGISPMAITGHEVPMPSYLRADDAETPSAEAEVPVSMQTAPDISGQLEAQPAVRMQESEPAASDQYEQPVATDTAQPSTSAGPTRTAGVPEIGAPSDAITQAVRALSETGPLRAGRRPARSTGPLGGRLTGPSGSSGASSPPPAQPTPVASSTAPAPGAPAEDRWSDSYLSQLEDFSLVLLAARTEKRPDSSQRVISRPLGSSVRASAVVAPEPEQQTLGDVPRDSAGVAPFEQVAEPAEAGAIEPQQPTAMLPGSEQVEQRPDLEPEDGMAASMAPIASDAAESVEEAQVADADVAEADVADAEAADATEAPEMAQVSESATFVRAASPEDEPAITEGRFSGDVMEFEPFMFDATAQPGPPLPHPEEFAPAVAEIANALEGVEDVAPFAPADGAVAQDDMPAQASVEAHADVAELPQAEPEPAPPPTVAPASSLPFWLKDTGDLQSALSLGHIHIEEQPPVEPAEQEPHMGTIEAEPVSAEIEPVAGVDDAPAMAQAASVEEFSLDDYSDLPPIEPFDVSALAQPDEEETFGFDTGELTGSFVGSKEALIVTTDLDALADLLGTSNTSEGSTEVVSQRATPDTTPATSSREEITGRLSPDMADRPRTPSWTSTVTSNLDMDPTGVLGEVPAQQAAEQGDDDLPVMGIDQLDVADLEYSQVDPFDFSDLNVDLDESDTMVFRVPVAPSTGMLEPDTSVPAVSSSQERQDGDAEDAGRRKPVTSALEPEQAARGTDILEGEVGAGVGGVREAPVSSNWQTRSWLDAEDLPSGGPSEEALLASEAPLFEEAEPQEFWPAEGEPPTGWLGDTGLPAFHATEELAEPAATQGDAPVQPDESQPAALDTSDVAASAEMPDLPLIYAQQEEPSRDQPPDWEHTGPLPQIDGAEEPEGWAPAGLEETHDLAAMQAEMPTGWLAESDAREALSGRDEVDTGSLGPGPEMEVQPAAAEEDITITEYSEAAMPQETPDDQAQPVPSVRIARADWAERRLMEMQDSDETAFMDAGNTLCTSEEEFTMATNRDNDNADQQPAAGGRESRGKSGGGGGFPFPPKLLSSGPLPELDSFNELQDMVNRNPDDLSAHMALAAAYTQAGELDPALRVYRRLLKKRNLSTTMMQMIADELAEFERDVSGQPRYHQVLGDLYMKQGLYREAIEEYNKIG